MAGKNKSQSSSRQAGNRKERLTPNETENSRESLPPDQTGNRRSNLIPNETDKSLALSQTGNQEENLMLNQTGNRMKILTPNPSPKRSPDPSPNRKQSLTPKTPSRASSEYIRLDVSDEFEVRSEGRNSGRQHAESTNETEDIFDRDFDHYRRPRRRVPFFGQFKATSKSVMNLNIRMEERENLEGWWVHSPIWRRTVPVMCITILSLSICNAVAAIYFFTAVDTDFEDFEVCKTEVCLNNAFWILEGLDRRVDPCEDFYRFTCNNYKNSDEDFELVPTHISFSTARFQFNKLGHLANALKPVNDPEDKLIPFYKSCLAIGRTSRTGLNEMAEIIHSTMPYLFTDIDNYDLGLAARNVALATGHIGVFGYQLLKFPSAALLPTQSWILEFCKSHCYNGESSDKLEKELIKSYKVLWKELELNYEKVQLDVDTVAKITVNILRSFRDVQFKHSPGSEDSIKFILQNLLGNVTPEVLEVEDRKFTSRDFGDILNKSSHIGQKFQRLGASLWIFCVLEHYAEMMPFKTFTDLNLDTIFPEKSNLQKISLERFCFRWTSQNLNGYAFKQFSRIMGDPTLLQENIMEVFKQMKQTLRLIYFEEGWDQNLSPFEDRVMSWYLNPRTVTVLNFPFPFDKASEDLINEIESFFHSFEPGPDYLINCWKAIVTFEEGRIKSWQEGRSNILHRDHFKLETFRGHIDNETHYENNLYPPIVLFNQPLFRNDLRVFDNAGAILYLSRSYLALWRMNLDDTGAVDKYINLERARNLTNPYDNQCMFRRKQIPRKEYFKLTSSSDAIAFIIAQRLLQRKKESRNLRFLEIGSLIEWVDPMIAEDRAAITFIKLQNGVQENYNQFNLKEDVTATDPDLFKFRFKKAPSGLEDFTEEQLFFLVAVRHHCYGISNSNRSLEYINSTNGVLEQLQGFSQAWSCPIGSPMNPPNKCI